MTFFQPLQDIYAIKPNLEKKQTNDGRNGAEAICVAAWMG